MVKFPLYIGPCKQRVSLNHCWLSICHCFSKSDRSRWLFFSDVSVKLHYLKIQKLTALFCRIFFFWIWVKKSPKREHFFCFLTILSIGIVGDILKWKLWWWLNSYTTFHVELICRSLWSAFLSISNPANRESYKITVSCTALTATVDIFGRGCWKSFFLIF